MTDFFAWADHPGMQPRPRVYFVTYWSSMPSPLKPAAADDAFVRLVRAGTLVQVRAEPPALSDLFS